MGEISFWYFWTIEVRKKLKNLILKKSKILEVASNGSISANWVFRVANFGFNYLRHFSVDFQNSCAHLTANFLNFWKHPKHFRLERFWRELWTKKHKNQKSDNMPYWATPEIKPFLGWDFSIFFLFIWFKSTKMKFRPYFTMERV